ncbi:MAG TPA: acylneuraminate cytidylyltransferase family protein [Polyangia bacterium]|nr:acylneuraminate cytidylyltransferase family protein [Polyangia bacterium]
MSAVLPCLTIITARGGSKGLAGKNVRPLAGLPLLVHSLRCAARVPRLTRVIVSTDSPEIAEIARHHGGDVPFLRPPELARDDTPSMPVLTHALAEIERLENRRYASVLLLEPTSPGRLPQDIEGALDRLEAAPDATMVLGCSEPTFNPYWVGVVEDKGRLEMVFPEMDKFKRRQDVPRFLRINGAIYLWRANFIRAGQDVWQQGKTLALEMPEARSFSIDDLYEFQVAELMISSGMVKLPWLDARDGAA